MTTLLSAFTRLDEPRHRAEFYRLWAVGLHAGFTHPKSLEIMGVRQSAATEAARRWLLAGTRADRDLATLVKAADDRFDPFERALLTLGEEGGRLEEWLRLLADFFERNQRLMQWVKKQMAYPVFTALAACFIAPFPLLFYGQIGAYFAAAAAGVAFLLAASGGLLVGVAARYGRRPPLVRARMARALATATTAGLPLPRAVRLAAAAWGVREVEGFVEGVSERELATTQMADVLRECAYLTPDFLGMLQTAETTGDYGALRRLAELYEGGVG